MQRCRDLTHQVAYEAQVGYGEQSSKNVEQHAVQCRHIHYHEVHVDCANHKDDDASGNFPHPEQTRGLLDYEEIQLFLIWNHS